MKHIITFDRKNHTACLKLGTLKKEIHNQTDEFAVMALLSELHSMITHYEYRHNDRCRIIINMTFQCTAKEALK